MTGPPARAHDRPVRGRVGIMLLSVVLAVSCAATTAGAPPPPVTAASSTSSAATPSTTATVAPTTIAPAPPSTTLCGDVALDDCLCPPGVNGRVVDQHCVVLPVPTRGATKGATRGP